MKYSSPLYMWRHDGNIYRFQTDQGGIATKLRRKVGFTQLNIEASPWFALFEADYARLELAKKSFARISGFHPQLNLLKDVYEVSSLPWVTPTSNWKYAALETAENAKTTTASGCGNSEFVSSDLEMEVQS